MTEVSHIVKRSYTPEGYGREGLGSGWVLTGPVVCHVRITLVGWQPEFVHLYGFIHTNVWMYTCMYVCKYAYTYISIHTYIYKYVYMHIHVLKARSMHAHTHTGTQLCTSASPSTGILTYTHMNAHLRAQEFSRTCTNIPATLLRLHA